MPVTSFVSYFVVLIFNIIYLILLTVVILSWMPIFDIRKEPLSSMHKFYNMIVSPFRAVIPPIGMFDISPFVAFLVLQLLENTLLKIFARFGI